MALRDHGSHYIYLPALSEFLTRTRCYWALWLIVGFRGKMSREDSEKRGDQGKIVLCLLLIIQIQECRLTLELHGEPGKDLNLCPGAITLAMQQRRGRRELSASVLTRSFS